MTEATPDTNPIRAADYGIAILLFVALLAVYHANLYLSFAADGTSNVYLALSMINDGDMVFTPSETPLLFEWSVANGGDQRPVDLTAIDASMEKLRESGHLVMRRPRYLIVPSIHEGFYVSTFNPGTSLFAAPPFAVAQMRWGDLRRKPEEMWYVAKFIAAAAVAASAAFVFLSVRTYRSRAAAGVIASAYALGTSVWTTSSQGLWQHGPVELFLAIAAFLLSRPTDQASRINPAATGFVLGFATLCRPTIGLVVLAVGLCYLLRSRRALGWYVIGGLPLAIFLAAYNSYYLGSPFTFGETSVADHAIEKTGSADNFPTPIGLGAAVGLFSPSRGLFVFSPFLFFALFGAIAIWLDARYRSWRPLTLGTLAIWITQFTYFDYWGGWSYGNRNLVDTTPMLAVFLTPIWPWLTRGPIRKLLLGLTIAWSISVQLLGAFAFDLGGWNGRVGYEIKSADGERVLRTFDAEEAERLAMETGGEKKEVAFDIDKPQYRYRFWSLVDSQIPFYVTHFLESNRRRIAVSEMFSKSRSQQLAENHARIGQILLDLGAAEAAADQYMEALRLEPDHPDYSARLKAALEQSQNTTESL